ncbi:MAG: hypothetical protein KBB52_01020 [Candidatus Omnitrophica bacterium]|nr:hypothetical protein [Candidatus Omnitrophota bacterium]
MKKVLAGFAAAFMVLTIYGTAFAKGEDVVKFYRDVTIAQGQDVNDVVAISGNITVFGRVGGNITALGGFVVLKPGSYVGGEIVSIGGEVIKEPGAELVGRVTTIYMPHFIPSFATILKGGWLALWATISILVLVGFLGLAILIIALMPDHMKIVVKSLETSFGIMLLWGLAWMILIVPIAALLAVSIIGVILIPVQILLVVLALIIGYIAAGVFIGKNILASFIKKTVPIVDALLGILVLFLIGFIPVVGPVIKVLFLTAGYGAVLVTRFGTSKVGAKSK